MCLCEGVYVVTCGAHLCGGVYVVTRAVYLCEGVNVVTCVEAFMWLPVQYTCVYGVLVK